MPRTESRTDSSPRSEAPSYFENPLMPGKKMFYCSGLNASLSVQSCMDMHTQASGDEPNDRLNRCRGCHIGAMHCGKVQPDASSLWGKAICSRCHRTDLRLLGGNVCVGCKNREYECLKGRNAKGRAPVKHPPLERRSVRYCMGGKALELKRSATIGTDELVVELLRDSAGQVLFGRGSQVRLPVSAQGSLF